MRRILIQCGDNLENSQRILAFATLLREAGCDPVVMTYTARYAAPFPAHGIRSVALDPYRPRRPLAERLHRFGFDPDLDDQLLLERVAAAAAARPLETARLRRGARRALVAVDRLVAELDPDAIVVWNGRTGFVANALRRLKTVRSLPGGFIERGPLPGGLFFDAEGTNGDASVARGGLARRLPDARLLRRRHGAALDRWLPSRDRVAGPSAARLLVPLQVQRDSNVLLHSPRIRTMRELVQEAARIRDLCLPDALLDVRPHPEEHPNQKLDLPTPPRACLSRGGDLVQWLRSGNALVTLNSTVGLEAALVGTVPVVFGEGIYCREEFVVRPDAGASRTLCERIAGMAHDPEGLRESVLDYAARMLDAHLVQPLGTARSIPEALLSEIAPDHKPPEPAPTLIDRLRRRLPTQGPLTVHAVGLGGVRLTVTYRETATAPTAKSIRAGLAPLTGADRRLAISARPRPERGDILLAPRNAEIGECGGYAVVLDETFAPHPAQDGQARR